MIKNIVTISIFLFFSLKSLSQNKLQDSTKVIYSDSLKKFKTEFTFFKAGILKTETLYYENKMIKLKYFSKEGKLLIESSYNLKGNEYGWQKEYYENGKIKKEKFITNYTLVKEKYNNEVFTVKIFNGPFSEYYENGLLKEEGCFINGLKVGLYKEYNANGELKKVEYCNPKP
jgi:antitoxin component YwqK of YwqJK toxin-antitoxin module